MAGTFGKEWSVMRYNPFLEALGELYTKIEDYLHRDGTSVTKILAMTTLMFLWALIAAAYEWDPTGYATLCPLVGLMLIFMTDAAITKRRRKKS